MPEYYISEFKSKIEQRTYDSNDCTLIKKLTKKLFSTGFFHIFGGNVINKVIGFFSSFILVRILTKTEYGIFTYTWNIYSVVMILGGMGIDSAIVQILSEHGGDQEYGKGVINFGSRIGLLYNLILCITLFVIGAFMPLKITGGKRLLCALCVLPLVQFLSDVILSYLRSQKKNQEFALISVLKTATLFLVSVCGAFVFREMSVVIGNYTAAIVSCIIGICLFHVYPVNKKRIDDLDSKKNLLKIGFISMSINALSQLLYLLDVFMIGLLDPQETILASYKIATMIPSALTFIPISLITYVYPYFAEHKDDEAWCLKKYKQLLMGIGTLNLFISVLLLVLAPFIIILFFGEQYLDAVPIFRILSVNYLFSGTFRIISGNLLVTQRKLLFNLIESIISSIINIAVDYFLILYWGSTGAAVATLLVTVISGSLSTVYLVITLEKKKTFPIKDWI